VTSRSGFAASVFVMCGVKSVEKSLGQASETFSAFGSGYGGDAEARQELPSRRST
jgi:hypothetical protein